MRKRRTAQSAFFNLRVLIGLFIVLAGVFLALAGLGAFSALAQSVAQAQQKNEIITNSKDPLVPNGFDCSKIHELGIDKQMNFRAGAIMIACGEAEGGGPARGGKFAQLMQKLLSSPLNYGGTDVDLITGTETYPYVAQSTTFSAVNPDNPQQIVVAYNDTRGRFANPINISGASVSTDGGTTFTRLTQTNGESPFSNTLGDPVILYSRHSSTWYTVWLDAGCGGQGLGGYKSTTPSDPIVGPISACSGRMTTGSLAGSITTQALPSTEECMFRGTTLISAAAVAAASSCGSPLTMATPGLQTRSPAAAPSSATCRSPATWSLATCISLGWTKAVVGWAPCQPLLSLH